MTFLLLLETMEKSFYSPRLLKAGRGEQSELVKLILFLLLGGMFAVSGWAQLSKHEPYSAELVKKAEAGDAQAQKNLAYCYEHNLGVTQDYKEAVKWYTKSAEQGDAMAQFNLGNSYSNGEGVTQDYKEAVKWYAKSAEQGDANGQYMFGFCYYNGLGVTEDKKEAVKWYTKSAEQGEVMAQFQLGCAYFSGEGVTQDYKESVKWYTKSADQGFANAQYNLGDLYFRGEGVAKDEKEAVKWYVKSSEQGFPPAKEALEKLETITNNSQSRAGPPKVIKPENVQDAEKFISDTEKDIYQKPFKTEEYQKCYNILKASKGEADTIVLKALYYLASNQISNATIYTKDEAEYINCLNQGIQNYKDFLSLCKNNGSLKQKFESAQVSLAGALIAQSSLDEARELLLSLLKTPSNDKRRQERLEVLLCNVYGLKNDLKNEEYYEKATGTLPRTRDVKFVPNGSNKISEEWDPLVKDLFVFEKRDNALKEIVKKNKSRQNFRQIAPIRDILICRQNAGNPIFYVICRTIYNSEFNKSPEKGILYRITSDGRCLAAAEDMVYIGGQIAPILEDGNVQTLKLLPAFVGSKDINMITLNQCDEKLTLKFAGYCYPKKNLTTKIEATGPKAKISFFDEKEKLADFCLSDGQWTSSSSALKVFNVSTKNISPEGAKRGGKLEANAWELIEKDLSPK